MLHGMSRRFWAEALSTAVYVKNRSPAAAVPGKTPFEALHGHVPNVEHLREFGSVCYSHIPRDERKKIDPKSRRCLFLGYGDTVKGYRLYDEVKKKVIYSRDVRFEEKRIIIDESFDEENDPQEEVIPGDENIPQGGDFSKTEEKNELKTAIPEIETHDDATKEETGKRTKRKTKEPDRFGEWAYVAKDPVSYKQAMKSDDKEKWKTAMETKFSLYKKMMFEI